MTVIDLQVDDRLARAAASAGLIGSVTPPPTVRSTTTSGTRWSSSHVISAARGTSSMRSSAATGPLPRHSAQGCWSGRRGCSASPSCSRGLCSGSATTSTRTTFATACSRDPLSPTSTTRTLASARSATSTCSSGPRMSTGWSGIVDGRRTEPPARPGFDRRFGKSSTYVLPNGHQIDVHRTLVMGPFGLSVDLSDLWGPGQEFTLAGRRLTALPTESRMLHAAYSCVLSDWPPRSHPRRDLAEMVLFGEYDATEVIDMARRWQAEVVLAVALTETWEYLGLADVTALSAWAGRYHVTGRDERLLAMYRREDAPYAKLALSSLPMLEGWGARATFTRSLALPDKEFLRHRRASLPSYLWRGTRRALRRTGR